MKLPVRRAEAVDYGDMRLKLAQFIVESDVKRVAVSRLPLSGQAGPHVDEAAGNRSISIGPMAIVDLGPEASAGFRGQNARRVSHLFEKTVRAGAKATRGGRDAERANGQCFSYAQGLPRNPVYRIVGKATEDEKDARKSRSVALPRKAGIRRGVSFGEGPGQRHRR